MQIVDDKMMLVTAASVLFQMRMIGWQVGMRMKQHRGVVAGPKPQGKSNTRGGQASENQKGWHHAKLCADLSGHRICHEPANMAERELGSEQCRAVLIRRRAFE